MEATVKATKKRMKRKDLDQVNDDFSDFWLSSPAQKIRRLDAELPPVVEGEDPQVLMSSERLSHEVQRAHDGPVIEELPPSSAAVNEERAIVLFRPVNIPILQQQSPSTLSVSVDPDLIYGFKNSYPWETASRSVRSAENDAEEAADSNRSECMAVVPLAASQFTPASEPLIEAAEEMEAEEAGEATMEIEDSSAAAAATFQQLPNQYGEMVGSEVPGLPHWQKHCMTPQFPPTTSSPILWYR